MDMMSANDVISHGLALPVGERLTVANQLLASLKPSVGLSEDDPGFGSELQRRIEEVESGKAVLIDGELALVRAHRRLDEMRKS